MGEDPTGDERGEHESVRGSYWRAIGRRHARGIGAGVLAVVLVAGAVAVAALRSPGQDAKSGADRTITPARPTTESTVTLPSYASTSTGAQGAGDAASSTAPTQADGTPAAGSTPPPIIPGRAALVAYRRDGWLCVASEDGTGERRVSPSAGGAFALSPDGSTIAFVEQASGTLSVADVASGRVVAVSLALQDTPSWAPDSAWLVFTAADSRVTRVTSEGARATALFAGSMPAVSTDGARVVGVRAPGEVVAWRESSLARVPVSGSVTGLACRGATLVYGAIATDGSVSLRSIGVDGKSGRTLVAAPVASRAVTFGDLSLSADGSTLAYAERGDDGYSRAFSLMLDGGTPVSLCIRRDCYPLRWSASGATLFFIEGNAVQGEPTALMRVDSDAQNRRLLLSGAVR